MKLNNNFLHAFFDMSLQMWKFFSIFEHNIHVPDISAENFHCLAKTSPFSQEPESLITRGVLHPTVQFLDSKFFKFRNLHVKLKFLGGRTLLDGIYPVPKKVPNSGPFWSSVDSKVRMTRNIAHPGELIEMEKICVPPDGIERRLMVTANAADEDGNDVLHGPVGYSVVAVKHKLRGGYRGEQVYELNRMSFF